MTLLPDSASVSILADAFIGLGKVLKSPLLARTSSPAGRPKARANRVGQHNKLLGHNKLLRSH